MGPHLDSIDRVYGPESWDVYTALNESLQPRGPDSLHALAREHMRPGSHILDVGCRDGAHLIQLVQATGSHGTGIDPVRRLLDRARMAVENAGLGGHIRFMQGVMQRLPLPDGSVDLVWCRDVIELVDDLPAGLQEVTRVLRPGGHAALFTVFATDLLEPNERALLRRDKALVIDNLDEQRVERAFEMAGLTVVVKDVIGTEWREYAEEQCQIVSREMLQLSRLRRQRERFMRELGPDLFDHLESTLHWEVFQFLGKLQPVVYLLQPTPKPSLGTHSENVAPGERSLLPKSIGVGWNGISGLEAKDAIRREWRGETQYAPWIRPA